MRLYKVGNQVFVNKSLAQEAFGNCVKIEEVGTQTGWAVVMYKRWEEDSPMKVLPDISIRRQNFMHRDVAVRLAEIWDDWIGDRDWYVEVVPADHHEDFDDGRYPLFVLD